MSGEIITGAGEIIIGAIIRAGAIREAKVEDIDGETHCTIMWAANAPEQVEAALEEAGCELVKK